tara:strand:+ start:19 stop:2613 length:2595 start_codon:yes stop_codon:yes gene_type:complete
MSLDTLQTINFAGKDGFQWFFAKVVPQEHWKGTADALNFDGKQSHRAKIRVCGYDTFEKSELPDEDCRWAQFLPSANVGDGTGGIGETLCLVGGESVLGFFADGPDGQVPMIFSVLPKAQLQVENKRKRNSDPDLSTENLFSHSFDTSKYKAHQYNKDIFENFASFTTEDYSKFDTPTFDTSIYVYKGEQNLASVFLEDSATIKISSIDKCGGNVVSQAQGLLQDFISGTQKLNNNLGTWIDPITNEIVNMDYQLDMVKEQMAGLLKGTVNNIRKKILKKLNKKFSKLLADIKTSIAGKNQNTSKGAQKASTGILGLIACVFKNVLGGIGAVIKNMFNNLLGKIVNGALCAVDQFVSGIFAKVFDTLEKGLSGIMSGLNWLVGGLSSITGLLRGPAAMAKRLLGFLNKCGAPPCTPSKTWSSAFAGGIIPAAPDDWGDQVSKINMFDNISRGLTDAKDRVLKGEDVSDVSVNGVPLQDTIDNTQAISDADDTLGLLGLGSIESALSQTSLFGAQNLAFDACNNRVINPTTQDDITPTPPGFIYPKCLPPVVKVSGTGTGAELLPIVGNDNRIFSIEVINGGSGYDETTGLVVVDNTGNGKGAFARPLVKDGVIQKVVLMKTGYGYCVNTTDDESVGIGTNVVGTVEDVFLDSPGFNYSPDDTVVIGDYEFPIITSPDGEVLGVTVPSDSTIEYNRFPITKFSTATGVGAKVVPIMSFTPQFKKDVNADKRKTTPLIGIDNVVDCIGDNRDPVGFVNGVEYSGPYHVMSSGLKMTGATHGVSDSIIYDTIEESLSNPVVSSSSYETPTETPTQTVTETPTLNVNTTPTIVNNPTTPTMDTTSTTDTSTSTGTDTGSSGGGYGGGY